DFFHCGCKNSNERVGTKGRGLMTAAQSAPPEEEGQPDDLIQALRRMEESFQTRLAAIQQAAEALSEHFIRRREAEEELRKSREELRALAARLQRVREEERASLARAIHDELSGALTALNMELSLLPSRVTQDLHQLLTQNTASMSEHIHHMLERVRIIATELRPAVL